MRSNFEDHANTKIEISQFLTLPKVPFRSTQWILNEEPLIDYSKNIMMTSDHNMKTLKQNLARKDATTKERDNWKKKMFASKETWVVEKIEEFLKC